MSNILSNSPIENIGALELNRASVLLSDDALEATAASLAAPTSANNCGTVWPCAHRIDDGALEGLAGTLSATPSNPAMCGPMPPTVHPVVCARIDDGALEQAAAMRDAGLLAPTERYKCSFTVNPAWCGRIDDGTLEAAALTMAPPTNPRPCTILCAPRIDDGAFEAAAAMAAVPSYNMGCSSTQGPMCRRIDDGALEASAGQAMAGPTSQCHAPTVAMCF